MFSVYCDEYGKEVLLSTRAVSSMRNTSEGIVLYYRCACGQPGVMTTGRKAKSPSSHHASGSSARTLAKTSSAA